VVADSSASRGWVRWLTPLGWIENISPLTDPQPLALLPIVGLVLVCGIATVVLAGRRDVYGSILQEREGRLARRIWLSGPLTLAFRLTRTAAIGWLLGIGASFALLGSAANAYASVLNTSPAITAALGRLGVRKIAEGYLGIEFFMVELLLTVLAATQLGGIRDEEASGRLDNLLVRPVRRVTWLFGRVAMVAILIVVSGLAAGVCTWFGASNEHIGVRLPTLLASGLNATAPAIFVLGFGILVFGIRPALTTPAAYAITAWSVLVDLLAAFLKNADWLRDSSLYTHIALAPAANPDWFPVLVMVGLGVAAAVVGAVVFARRDVDYA